MSQLAFPTEVSFQEITREKSLGGAIGLCLKAAGLEHKQVQADLKLDKAQFSRWESGHEGVLWPKLVALMDHCGNDSPLLWMVHSRGFDLESIRRRETAFERENRLLRDEVKALRRALKGALE